MIKLKSTSLSSKLGLSYQNDNLRDIIRRKRVKSFSCFSSKQRIMFRNQENNVVGVSENHFVNNTKDGPGNILNRGLSVRDDFMVQESDN